MVVSVLMVGSSGAKALLTKALTLTLPVCEQFPLMVLAKKNVSCVKGPTWKKSPVWLETNVVESTYHFVDPTLLVATKLAREFKQIESSLT